jgi:RNA polymerase sigma factor (TIGR02999 family)
MPSPPPQHPRRRLAEPPDYCDQANLSTAKISREAPGQTLQPTALVHEAWFRLGGDGQRWENRAHFFGAAAHAMRRKLAALHDGSEHVDVAEVDIAAPGKNDELLAVHDALDALAAHDAREAELVKLRYFAGLSIDEAAGVLGIAAPTAKRDWTYARVWLFAAIRSVGILP